MKKLLMISALSMILVACGGAVKEKDLVQKYQLTPNSAVHWDQTMIQVIPAESKLADWYGNENPINYLQKTGRMNEKDFNFLVSLSQRKAEQISKDEYEQFLNLLTSYVNSLPRKFFLSNTNIKDPKGLVKLMVRESNSTLDNPSRYIKESIASPEEWKQIVTFASQDDLNEKDVKKLRKILNSFIKDPELYNPEVWYRREVSDRMLELTNMQKAGNLTKMEQNNINAKALYLAYPEYFSKLDKWDK